MPLDGLLINKLIFELTPLIGGRIQKISQVGNNDFLFIIHKYQNFKLFISLDRNQYRIALTNKEYQSPENPTMFTMLLRKHFEGGILTNIIQHNLDRIVTLEIEKLNEFGDNKFKKCVLELMGKNSNLILLDNTNQIIDSFKHIGISQDGQTILPKAIYNYPNQNKYNVLLLDNKELEKIFTEKIFDYKDIVNLFSGFSPLIAKIIINSLNPLQKINEILYDKPIPTITKVYDKEEFTFTKYGEIKKCYSNISTMLEEYFYEKTIHNLIQEKSNNLKTHLKNTIIKYKNKLIKLDEELDNAINSSKYQKYGTLLISNLYQLKETKNDSINVFDYETNDFINIPLDPLFSLKENANRYFTKYQKSKKAIKYIEEQINKTKDEIEYLSLIEAQISVASISDIEDIKNELIDAHYIKNTGVIKNKKKNKKIDILTYLTSENTLIYVGKNNIQNEYITHVLAKGNELWFHVKDSPSSHVLLQKTDNYTEEEIRMAANLAAYYSPYKDSSSVAIDYTKIKYVKKIPGKRNCFVTYTNQKTIYIDPNKNLIDNYKRKK